MSAGSVLSEFDSTLGSQSIRDCLRLLVKLNRVADVISVLAKRGSGILLRKR